ncbi:hypothetical protein DPMN_074121 [Dreissena polymorpha]|uniref:Uncharacterized protein n=1 Tax=Dreissena polymorpha TaxID=45954 RepID=A0A9D4BN13_DREPO|nr:hypothetical protein DPMN_074121 [Dreissena polymorpha]
MQPWNIGLFHSQGGLLTRDLSIPKPAGPLQVKRLHILIDFLLLEGEDANTGLPIELVVVNNRLLLRIGVANAMSDEKSPGGLVVEGDSDADVDFELLIMPLEFSEELLYSGEFIFMQDLWVQTSHLSQASSLFPKSMTASEHGYLGVLRGGSGLGFTPVMMRSTRK